MTTHNQAPQLNPGALFEPMLSVKELTAEIHARTGLTVSDEFVRCILRAGVRRIGYNARATDLLAWWEAHPDFSPRSKK